MHQVNNKRSCNIITLTFLFISSSAFLSILRTCPNFYSDAEVTIQVKDDDCSAALICRMYLNKILCSTYSDLKF